MKTVQYKQVVANHYNVDMDEIGLQWLMKSQSIITYSTDEAGNIKTNLASVQDVKAAVCTWRVHLEIKCVQSRLDVTVTTQCRGQAIKTTYIK